MKTGWGYVTATIVFALGLGLSTANAQQKMYWVGDFPGQIVRANLDGSGFEVLVDVPEENPWGVALDLVDGMIYWTDSGANKIRRARVQIPAGELPDNRTDVEDLVTVSSTPWSIALDISGGKMYWTTSGPSQIQRSNLDGSAVEDLVTSESFAPRGIALDVAGGKMYWADRATPGIHRADLNGANVEDLVEAPFSTPPRSIALDVEHGKMYWLLAASMALDFKIQRANLDGSEIEVLVDPSGYGNGIAVDPLSQHVYWTTLVGGGVKRANLDGTGVETLIGDMPFQGHGLALDLRAAPIPTISEWGMLAMTVLLLAFGAIVIVRRSSTARALGDGSLSH